MSRRSLTLAMSAALTLSPALNAYADGPARLPTRPAPPAAAAAISASPDRVYEPLAGSPPPPPPAPAAAQTPGVLRVDLAAGPASRSLSLPKGKSAVVELPVDARDVFVTNPAVADAVPRSPRRIYVMGVGPGQTDAVFTDAAGKRILTLDIRVDQDVAAMSQTISRVLPTAQVRAEAVNDSVVLTGVVANAADADRAAQIAARFVAKPENVINLLTIAGKDQVMLKVRIVEVQRTAIKQLGLNMSAVLGQLGGVQYQIGKAITYGVNGSLLGGLTGGYSLDTTQQPELQLPCAIVDPAHASFYSSTDKCPQVVKSAADAINYKTATSQATVGSSGLNKANALIQAFERNGLVRTLAEPNLTTSSGEAAKFLAGGEFPVPTGSDSTGKTQIEFKQYGVGLGFTPVVLSGGRISVKLSTEVSELTNQGAFSLSTGSGSTSSTLTIPGLNVRRAENTIELPSGGSLMIAGLLQDKASQQIDSLPGLTNLPVLGQLFNSRDYLAGQTELVVIVTAYLVDPTRPGDLATPADGLELANDAETILLGHLNRVVKAKPEANAGRTYQGPYGYVIE